MVLVSLRGGSLNRAVVLQLLGMATAGARHPRNLRRPGVVNRRVPSEHATIISLSNVSGANSFSAWPKIPRPQLNRVKILPIPILKGENPLKSSFESN